MEKNVSQLPVKKGERTMRSFKKILSFALVLLLMLSICVSFSSAEDTKTIKLLSYNVAGLPSIQGIIGMQDVNVPDNQYRLGKQLNSSGFDIIAVQEDFGYHCLLSSGLTSYPYKTIHSGGIPGGDGMNIFSKYPIYNAKRTTWEMAYGVITEGADELTPKGILYSVIDLGDGLFVDLYVIHADAFDGEGSRAARNDNFRQLAALIASKGSTRPVIVTGDFNTSSHLDQGAEFTRIMIREAKFKDAWTELYNGGDYSNYSGHGGSYWGNWDSVEKVLYRDGGGLHIEANSFEYKDFTNKGVSISDHKAAAATLTFTKTENVTPSTEKLRVTKPDLVGSLVNKVSVTVKDLQKIALHFDDLLGLLKG